MKSDSPILVRIIKNWSEPDIMRQTPGGTGLWNNVQFTTEPVESCDYLIILNYSQKPLVVNCPEENVWAFMQEPYVEDITNWVMSDHGQYAKVITHSPVSADERYLRSQTCLPWHVNMSYDKLVQLAIPQKTKMLSLITSNKARYPGHKERMVFIEHLMSRLDIPVDLFGRGINPIEDKWQGLAEYKYSLAIENSCASDYWTEKIADCFLTYTLPIYYGCTNIGSYFPEGSYITIDIRNPADALQSIKRILEDDPWEARLPLIEEARDLVLNKYQLFPFVADRIERQTQKKAPVFIMPYPLNILQEVAADSRIELSVVVCTYNRADALQMCLQSLAAQAAPGALFEVIVVDNNSTDTTLKVAELFRRKFRHYDVIGESKQGLSFARNRGVAESNARYIAFLDDDVIVSPQWVQRALFIIQFLSPDIFGGPFFASGLDDCPAWFKDAYRTVVARNTCGWMSEGLIAGCNICFSKSLLGQYGGFDITLGMTGEEVRFHEESALLFRAYKEQRNVYYHIDLAVKHGVHEYAKNLAYFIYVRYQIAKERFHLIGKQEFDYSEIGKTLSLINDMMNDYGYALRKRDKSVFPYVENYIIEVTNNYLPEIARRVEYFSDSQNLSGALIDHICQGSGLERVAARVVRDKGMLTMLKHLIYYRFSENRIFQWILKMKKKLSHQ